MSNAFATAFQQAGLVTAAAPTPDSSSEPAKKTSIVLPKANGGRSRSEWGTSGRPNILEWKHPNFGSIYLEPDATLLGEVIHPENSPNTWARLNLEGRRPEKVLMDFNYRLNDGVELFYGFGDKFFDTADQDPEPFEVPIEWNGRVPHLPHGTKYVDFQFYLYNRKISLLAHIDNSIVGQMGKLYVTSQLVTAAQAIKHPWNTAVADFTSLHPGSGEDYMTLIPYYNENAHPGFDPVASIERTYPGRMVKIFEKIHKWGTALDADKCLPGQWQPNWPADVPQDLAKVGFKKAVVRWFNLSLAYGQLELEDGAPCFVYFKEIENAYGVNLAKSGKFALLDNGAGVYVRPETTVDKKTGQPGLKAAAVRPA